MRNKAVWNIFTLFKQDSLTGLERNENNYSFTISKNIITSKTKSTIKDQPYKILLPIVPNKENPLERTLMWCCIFSELAWHIRMLFKNMSCRLHRTIFFLREKKGNSVFFGLMIEMLYIIWTPPDGMAYIGIYVFFLCASLICPGGKLYPLHRIIL